MPNTGNSNVSGIWPLFKAFQGCVHFPLCGVLGSSGTRQFVILQDTGQDPSLKASIPCGDELKSLLGFQLKEFLIFWEFVKVKILQLYTIYTLNNNKKDLIVKSKIKQNA